MPRYTKAIEEIDSIIESLKHLHATCEGDAITNPICTTAAETGAKLFTQRNLLLGHDHDEMKS